MINSNLDSKKKLVFILLVCNCVWLIIIIRLVIIQLVEGKDWYSKANNQLHVSRTITANRGTIYDSSGEIILAQSSSVQSVSVNPLNILKENKEKVAKAFSEIFELDYEKVLKKVNKNSSIETIVKRVDKDKTDELRIWMQENNIFSGINIDEDTKRYYPYSTLASHIIGFIGSDNQGLDGIEAKYDEVLTGENGSISKMMDAKGNIIGDNGENYENSNKGNDLILSIDMNIQGIVEKYLEQACIENICTDGGNVIIMDPNNGDILAMATYPYYDLNNPYEVTDENIASMWSELESKEKNTYLQAMWRNKAIADTYEPGSTFKLVTASASLEEGIAETDRQGAYCCNGAIEIAGVRIKCWRYYRPHGSESLREGLMNSCNPVFIGLGQKLGVPKYYEYLRKFGFLEKTGIDLIGEAKSIFLKEEKVGPVELATISFGQRFEVTPIQMITMVSSIANDGVYVKPRVVKAIVDSKTGERKDIEPVFKDNVISKETSEKVLSMMTSVVSEGTGKNARVQGYNVGGKTGTSEDGVNTGKYVTSFIGVAPTDNPKVAILVTLYNPTGEAGHQGGTVAAPIAGKILNEVINYLEISPTQE
jgi:stage V sporulation protein D (sporulation-specific penicillin-binding protein)